MKKPVALITGGSSGIGKATAVALQKMNYKVYTMSRREVQWDNEDIIHMVGDICSEIEVVKVFKEIMENESTLDIMVLAAGYGISGGIEFTEMADAQRQMQVNFFGTFLCMKYGGRIMRKQGHGRIFYLSSVAGEIAIPFQGFYTSSKAASSKLMEAYGGELAPYGVECCVIMPGDVKTPFTEVREKSPKGDIEYQNRISKSVLKMENDERKGMSAEYVGEFIAKKAIQKSIRPYYGVDKGYAALLMLYRFLPRKLARYIVNKMYG
ncbi:MAG: SDR family NAD(P)-dependent oxidoreductase [Tissierellia bacterium]|nr:SDR family NAD(P)-dependent oxidoreductase [Tissierellia bacterium]